MSTQTKSSHKKGYDRHAPFLATLLERSPLTPFHSEKQTYHLVVDLAGSGIEYQVGDCVAILPQNPLSQVIPLLDALGFSGTETINHPKTDTSLTIKAFLISHADLSKVPKKLMRLFSVEMAETLQTLLKGQKTDPQTLVNHLAPLLPRFYSIASSMKQAGNAAHLTVAVTGVCTQYLCHKLPLNTPCLPLYHQPTNHFSLSEASFEKPIIMIGPGTGIAPFIGFLQERASHGAKQNWLFFGEQKRDEHFYYERELLSYIDQGFLELDTAFSRDQKQKIYVQHKMLEKASKLWSWLQNGAILFVCGDAAHMAKDVEKTLLTIISQEGSLSSEEALNYIKDLRKQKRYLRDIY